MINKIAILIRFPLKCAWHLQRKCSLFLQKKVALRSDVRLKNLFLQIQPLFKTISFCDDETNSTSKIFDLIRFGCHDLLGTGWISRCRKMNSDFDDLLEIHKSAATAYKKKISSAYHFLDWQNDPRSGQRGTAKLFWKENMAFSGRLPGFDIKQPWELGRMQYLPELAYYAIGHQKCRESIRTFFKDTVLDFYVSNPYDMGCQWACSMDIAVRAVNLIIAWNIIKSWEAPQDADVEFDAIFSYLIFLHGKHIFCNLEKQMFFANNHYFADLCGLLFIGASLKSLKEGQRWFSFAEKEFRKQLFLQFLPDGGNFEASTTYHVQVGEMVVFTIALLIGQRHFQKWSASQQQKALALINKIREMTKAIIAPDNRIVQIGDNDSGIFLHLNPVRHEKDGVFMEERRDATGFLAASSVLISDNGIEYPDAALIRALLQGQSVVFLPPASSDEKTERGSESSLPDFAYREEKEYDLTPFPPEELNFQIFQDFGLAIWNAPGLWLSFFWGQPGQCGVGGHSHDDKLSVILYLNGKPVLDDPGSFCYTGNAELRNRYRSCQVHPFAVSVISEEYDFSRCGIFAFPGQFSVEILHSGKAEMSILLRSGDRTIVRTIHINPAGKLQIKTFSNRTLNLQKVVLTVSDCYGHTENRKNIA